MEKWHLFLISIGFLLIASSPVFENKAISIIMGVVLIAGGFMLMRKNSKRKK
nr:hypothetical protein [Tissierella sp.]